MFHISRSLALSAGATLIALGLGTAALAHGSHGRGFGPREFGRGWHDGGLGRLDLTAAQRDQIRDIRQRHESELRAAAERLRLAHDTQREAIEAVPLDEARIRAASQPLADAQAEMAVLRARIHSEVWTLLTPEQQARAKELKTQRIERRKERQQRM